MDDDYPTCAMTHATLRLYPGDLDPALITARLEIEPTVWQRAGEIVRRSDGGPPRIAPINGWFLGSLGQVQSKDSRRHIDWLLDRIAPRADALRALQEAGCRMDITCYWVSQEGHGGPTVPVAQMKRLADLDLELWFDVYGPFEEASADA